MAPSPLQPEKYANWTWPALLGLLITILIFSSYPMMRPGFDVWWHLGVIDAPYLISSSAFPTSRIVWHIFWHEMFAWLNVHNLFERALIIHRTQFFVSALLLSLTAYFLFSAMTKGLSIDSGLLWTASLSSAVIWMILNGTRSIAHDGGAGADVTQSWILWYSINYQISLPFVLFAMALLLFAVSGYRTKPKLVLLTFGMVLALIFSILVHVAEVAYYLMASALVLLLYLRGRRGWQLALLFFLFWVALLSLALLQSYRLPKIFNVFDDGGLIAGIASIRSMGASLREAGLTRIDTGWHILHTVSVLSLACGIVLMYWRSKKSEVLHVSCKAAIFVLLTAMFPLALMTDFGTGLYAYLTHPHIAWRFSLSSLIFVGIPFFFLVAASQVFTKTNAILRQSLFIGAIAIICAMAIIPKYSEQQPVSKIFGQSLLNSLSPETMYFGINEAQQKSLSRISSFLRSRASQKPICTDIYTAYYLFFLERYRYVSLPQSLTHLPGYVKTREPCSYASKNSALSSMELKGIIE